MWPFRRRLPPGTVQGDRSSVVVEQPEAFAMFVAETHDPGRNQAESGRVNRPVNPAPIYRNVMGPVFFPNGYDGFVGTFNVTAARVVPIVNAQDYNGIMPTREQPTLTKPLPYK